MQTKCDNMKLKNYGISLLRLLIYPFNALRRLAQKVVRLILLNSTREEYQQTWLFEVL
jgi:hypothetical protein